MLELQQEIDDMTKLEAQLAALIKETPQHLEVYKAISNKLADCEKIYYGDYTDAYGQVVVANHTTYEAKWETVYRTILNDIVFNNAESMAAVLG